MHPVTAALCRAQQPTTPNLQLVQHFPTFYRLVFAEQVSFCGYRK